MPNESKGREKSLILDVDASDSTENMTSRKRQEGRLVRVEPARQMVSI